MSLEEVNIFDRVWRPGRKWVATFYEVYGDLENKEFLDYTKAR